MDIRNLKLKELSRRANSFYDSKQLLWVIICFGIVLRLAQYLSNRALWLNEAYLALNIVNRSFSELLQPLDPFQAAPIGFLIVEKLLVQIFGNSEYVLRLFPFLCGIISLFLFCRLATHYIATKAVPIALGLFAVSDSLIYHSSEVKQYSSDVVIGLLLLYVAAIYIQSERLTTSRIALFGAIGAIAIWFSHPAVFILAGVGASLALFCLGAKEWPRIARLSIIYSIWILSFAACYFVSLRDLSHHERLLSHWSGGFMPFPPMAFSDAKWFVKTFFKIFDEPAGLSLPHIAGLTFLIGCISMFFAKKKALLVLISPIPFVLLASGLHSYPFSGRLLLFVAPFLLLFIAEGAEQIRVKTRHNFPIIGIALIGLLVFPPLLFASYHLIKPRTREEIKPVISYVVDHKQDGDLLYVYYGSWPAFEFYSDKYGFKKSDYVEGVSSRDNPSRYIEDLDKLRGKKRVWILFSHVRRRKSKGIDEERLFLDYLDSIGRRLDSFKSIGAVVYLYDLG